MGRFVLVLAVLACIAAWATQRMAAQGAAAGERPGTRRTAWGDPDLQGIWSYATNTPLQRPAEYAGREWLTAEEVAAANLESQTFATSARASGLSPLFDLSLNYNQFWWDLGVSTGRTSLITDPADGRLPPKIPERQAYEASPEAQRLQAVERDGSLAGLRGAAVRVRVPRGELQHDESPRGFARGGVAPLRDFARSRCGSDPHQACSAPTHRPAAARSRRACASS